MIRSLISNRPLWASQPRLLFSLMVFQARAICRRYHNHLFRCTDVYYRTLSAIPGFVSSFQWSGGGGAGVGIRDRARWGLYGEGFRGVECGRLRLWWHRGR